MNDFWKQIIYNVIGGALVAILTWLFLKLVKRYYKWNFKRIFGRDSDESFFIVHGSLRHRDCFEKNGNTMEWPYYKDGITGSAFKAFSVTSLSETRSAKYLSETFGKVIDVAPELVSDNEKREKLDISFCSLGGYNNFKTIDVLESRENKFFKFSSDAVVTIEGQKKEFRMHGDYDYGVIIKIIPKNFPKRVWIITAGLGEWGTSGSAWYLSRNWKKMPKNQSFGLIIKTKIGQDESAELIEK